LTTWFPFPTVFTIGGESSNDLDPAQESRDKHREWVGILNVERRIIIVTKKELGTDAIVHPNAAGLMGRARFGGVCLRIVKERR
jgi:hypothetical protein